MMMFEQVTFLKPLKQILVTFKSEVRWVKGVEAHVCGCLIIPGFCSMKWSGVPLLITLKPGWEMCPSQVLLASSILLSFTGSFPVPYYSCILSGGENPPLPPPPLTLREGRHLQCNSLSAWQQRLSLENCAQHQYMMAYSQPKNTMQWPRQCWIWNVSIWSVVI